MGALGRAEVAARVQGQEGGRVGGGGGEEKLHVLLRQLDECREAKDRAVCQEEFVEADRLSKLVHCCLQVLIEYGTCRVCHIELASRSGRRQCKEKIYHGSRRKGKTKGGQSCSYCGRYAVLAVDTVEAKKQAERSLSFS